MAQQLSKVIRLSTDGSAEVVTSFRTIGDSGERAFQRVGAASKTVSRDLDDVTRSTGNLKAGPAQLSLQLQDVFAQLQAGTPILTTLVQQGSQAASAFGPWGAIVGAAGAAVGGLAARMFDFNSESERTGPLLEGRVELAASALARLRRAGRGGADEC